MTQQSPRNRTGAVREALSPRDRGLLFKRDISSCNYITQNKRTKLEHSAINAGNIDFCTVPNWLINSRCSCKPIPEQTSLQYEANMRILNFEIPSYNNLLLPHSLENIHLELLHSSHTNSSTCPPDCLFVSSLSYAFQLSTSQIIISTPVKP